MICVQKPSAKPAFYKARFVRKRTLVSASTTLTAQRSPSCHASLSLGAELHRHTKATASVAIGTAYTSNQQKMNIHFWKTAEWLPAAALDGVHWPGAMSSMLLPVHGFVREP